MISRAKFSLGAPLHVHAGVEEGEHGRVLRDADHEIAEVAGAVAVEQVELQQHLAVVAHLLLAGGEVAVPEQRHLLFQRPVRVEHAVGPPVGGAVGLEPARAQPVEELVHHRLHAAIAAGLDLHAQRLALVPGEVGGGGPAGAGRVRAPGSHTPESFERLQLAVVDALVVHQMADCLRRRSCRRDAGFPPASRQSRRAPAGARRARSSSPAVRSG